MPMTGWTNWIGPGQPIRAADINELIAAINTNRSAAGLAPFPWTDPAVTAGVTPVKAVHLTEMRQAILELWQRRDPGCQLPPWTADGPDGTGPVAGRVIYAQDPLDLRAWLNQYEDQTI